MSILKWLQMMCFVLVLSMQIFLGFYWWLNQQTNSGVITLESNKYGEATITTETETGTVHSEGEDVLAAVFAQGYSHAQARLWQITVQRAMARGQLAEIFGVSAVGIDKFARTLGFQRLAEVEWTLLDSEE